MDLIKGFKDYIGEDAMKREAIRKIIVDTFEKYAFNPVETPIIEAADFVKGENASDEAVSDIYRLKDKGKRDLALRYEFTFQLKRLMINQKMPFRRYQIGPVFRDEPVKGNRLRQFVQCDCDIVGSKPKDEAEVFFMAKELLDSLKVPFVINVNNRRLLNEILEKEGVNEKNRADVIRVIDKLDKVPESVVLDELKNYGAESVLAIFKKNEASFEKYESYNEIKELKKCCKLYGVEVNFQPTLARGLAYYNGTIFEIKTKKMKETITAGGAYEFNATQCFGISFGLDRLASLAEIEAKQDDFLIVSLSEDKQSVSIAKKLRKKGTRCQIYYGKPSKAFAYANSYNFTGVIFVGAQEVKKKKFRVKNLETGREKILVLEKKVKKNVVVKTK